MKDYGEDLEGRIAAYIDGKLPPAEAARLEVFLANSDPALAEQVITMIADRHAVRALPKPHAPEDLASRIMEQVERTSLLNDSEHFAAPRRPWWQSRLAVAAALLLILGGFSWFILEAVRRPDTTWRQTVMDDGPRREESRDLAAAQKTLPPTLPPAAASAPTAIASAPTAIGGTGGGRAAPSPVPATVVAPLPDAAAPQLAAAPQTLTEAADKQPSEPLEITLVARSPEDESRLRAELARFADANSAVASQLAGNTSQLNNVGPQAEGQSIPAANAARAQNQLAQNNSNYTEQLAARNAAPENAAARQQNGGQNAAQNARNFQYYDTNRRAFNAPAESRAAKDESPLSSSAPYRVSLRPDQLRQLTADFKLQSESPSTLATDATTPTTTTQPAQKQLGALSSEKPADVPIDCIITLLPAPTPAATQPR